MMRVPMMIISLARAFVGGLAPLAPTTTRGMRSQTRRGGRRAAPYSDVAEACAALGRRAAELTRANTSPDLVVVPTPLGEPADLTVRAIAALAAADVVACEDTRVAGLLYEAAGIERKAAFVRHDAATAATAARAATPAATAEAPQTGMAATNAAPHGQGGGGRTKTTPGAVGDGGFAGPFRRLSSGTSVPWANFMCKPSAPCSFREVFHCSGIASQVCEPGCPETLAVLAAAAISSAKTVPSGQPITPPRSLAAETADSGVSLGGGSLKMTTRGPVQRLVWLQTL